MPAFHCEKSPYIHSEKYHIKKIFNKFCFAKLFNSGSFCESFVSVAVEGWPWASSKVPRS